MGIFNEGNAGGSGQIRIPLEEMLCGDPYGVKLLGCRIAGILGQVFQMKGEGIGAIAIVGKAGVIAGGIPAHGITDDVAGIYISVRIHPVTISPCSGMGVFESGIPVTAGGKTGDIDAH